MLAEFLQKFNLPKEEEWVLFLKLMKELKKTKQKDLREIASQNIINESASDFASLKETSPNFSFPQAWQDS